jgi:hypothetical protein
MQTHAYTAKLERRERKKGEVDKEVNESATRRNKSSNSAGKDVSEIMDKSKWLTFFYGNQYGDKSTL